MFIEVPDNIKITDLHYLKQLISEMTADCWCGRCEIERRSKVAEETNSPHYVLTGFMIVCPECGNKRCPRASWHGYKCNHSNEPGQVGEKI